MSATQKFIRKYRKVDTLIGPSTVYAYRVNGKLVILFGDLHSETCDETEHSEYLLNFLNDLFTVSKKCIDFFIETVEFSKISKTLYPHPTATDELKVIAKTLSSRIKSYSKHTEVSGIHKVAGAFVKCYAQRRVKCPIKYSGVRFHNIDLRYVVTSPFAAHVAMHHVFMIPFAEINPEPVLMEYYQALVAEGGYIKMFDMLTSGVLYKMLPFYDRVYAAFHPNKYFTKNFVITDLRESMYYLISKQLAALPETLRESLVAFMRKEFVLCNDYLLNDITETGHPRKVRMIKLMSCIMDVYTLARLLKTSLYADSNVIVCYAGDAHTNRYARFLKEHYTQVVNENAFRNVCDIDMSEYDTVEGGCIRTEYTGFSTVLSDLSRQLELPGEGCSLKPFRK